MKNKNSFPNFFFRLDLSGLVIILLLVLNAITIAQETQPGEFIIGSTFSDTTRYNWTYYNSFDTSGMNTVFQYANSLTNDRLSPYNVVATNGKSSDWIMYYATCYYSKWEAEQNQSDPLRVGVKHNGGTPAYWDDAWCWSTRNLVTPACSLIYGPHYRQDNRYKSWQHGDRHDVRYYVRFRMGLENSEGVDSTLEVCKIKVVYRYATVFSSEPNDWIVKDTVFLERTLKVGDFPSAGSLEYFYLDDDTLYYRYPSKFHLPKYPDKEALLEDEYPKFEDSQSDQGIQFWVDWLIDNQEESSLNLYVDNIEVYDRDWEEYLNPDTQDSVVFKIQNYAANYSEWDNLKYWSGHDEPYSIDAFAPIRTVDSLLYNNPQLLYKHRLLQTFNPYWTDDDKINGDTLLCQYVRMANPEKLFIDFYPFSPSYPFRYDDAEALRFRFQLCSQLQPGFWYMGQGFGESYWNGNQWVDWVDRYPDSSELKASVMLALAHGSKGIFFFCYDSWKYNDVIYGGDNVWHYVKGLVDTLDVNGNLPVNDLWYLVRDNLAPRLKGKLGKTLMSLEYTGNFINQYCNGTPHDIPVYDYLTLDCAASYYHWHAGFFDHKDYPDDKHFLLTNLRTVEPIPALLTVRNNTNYNNVCFTDIEGGDGRADTTIENNSAILYIETMPAGEGRLYRVAPVIKYGGRLLYSEATTDGMILYDDMIIESGAVLTVNGVYSSKGNITVKSGGIINGGNGIIQFVEGKKLIIEGSGSITGASNSKLHLVFTPGQNDDPTCIEIKAGGSLTIINCKIENATIGINSLLNANYLNAQNVEFIDCETHSINIVGRSSGMSPLPPPQIKNCTMINSDIGIWITNLPGMLIQGNTITNTGYGIYLSNVTDAQVIENHIQANTAVMPAIFLSSTGGAVRGNIISGHTVGIHLANSSPDVGGNDITDCLQHGMYIGSGSNPNMISNLVMNQGTREWYAVSGYNRYMKTVVT